MYDCCFKIVAVDSQHIAEILCGLGHLLGYETRATVTCSQDESCGLVAH